jgi:hypothetical protein
MNPKLKFGLILGAVLIPCTFIFIIALMVMKSNRRKSNYRKRRWQGTASCYTSPTTLTPQYWLPPTTPQKAPTSTQQAGDASDGIVAHPHAAFSQDGRGESVTLPPSAVTRNVGGSSLGPPLQQSSTLPIHMDGAER